MDAINIDKNYPPGLRRAHRCDTLEYHEKLVGDAIQFMKASLGDKDRANLSLEDLCAEVGSSKSHFISIFEEVTGTTPHHFLASLRIQRAKELLLATAESVTEIAFDVGYESFPTFSRTFSEYVGLSPLEFRRMQRTISGKDLVSAATSYIAKNMTKESSPIVEGKITLSEALKGVIFVGAFTKGVPQGIPHSGTVLLRPGTFRIRQPTDKRYYLLVAHVPLPFEGHLSTHFIPVDRVASIRIDQGRSQQLRLEPRPIRITDPPLVVALTALLR